MAMAITIRSDRSLRHNARVILPCMEQLFRFDKTTLKVFSSFEEAEVADREYYRSLSSAQRMEILLFLREHYSPYDDELTKGFKRVCRVIERS